MYIETPLSCIQDEIGVKTIMLKDKVQTVKETTKQVAEITATAAKLEMTILKRRPGVPIALAGFAIAKFVFGMKNIPAAITGLIAGTVSNGVAEVVYRKLHPAKSTEEIVEEILGSMKDAEETLNKTTQTIIEDMKNPLV